MPIEWTDRTWNPWYGCTKVSPGCKYCYMYRETDRFGIDPTPVTRSKKGTFNHPSRLKTPQKIFTCSWSDFFIAEADDLRPEAWDIIRQTPHHTYQILTKRPERVKECLPEDWHTSAFDHVWIGVSIEDQETFHQRIPYLWEQWSSITFVSFEPLLGPINLFHANMRGYLWQTKAGSKAPDPTTLSLPFQWAIIGGESGNENGKWQYRPTELHWITNLVEQLRITDCAIFVKQLGTYLAKKHQLKDRRGGDPTEWNKFWQLNDRQFPTIPETPAPWPPVKLT